MLLLMISEIMAPSLEWISNITDSLRAEQKGAFNRICDHPALLLNLKVEAAAQKDYRKRELTQNFYFSRPLHKRKSFFPYVKCIQQIGRRIEVKLILLEKSTGC